MSLCKKQDVTLCPACLIYKSGNRQTLEINLQNEILVPTAWSHRFSQTSECQRADTLGGERRCWWQ